jgi:hypothetical protein
MPRTYWQVTGAVLPSNLRHRRSGPVGTSGRADTGQALKSAGHRSVAGASLHPRGRGGFDPRWDLPPGRLRPCCTSPACRLSGSSGSIHRRIRRLLRLQSENRLRPGRDLPGVLVAQRLYAGSCSVAANVAAGATRRSCLPMLLDGIQGREPAIPDQPALGSPPDVPRKISLKSGGS